MTSKDLVTHGSDVYYTKLTGFVLKAGKTRTFYFDNTAKADHFEKIILVRTELRRMRCGFAGDRSCENSCAGEGVRN